MTTTEPLPPPASTPAPTTTSVISKTISAQPAILAFLVTVIGLVGGTVLLALKVNVPDIYWGITGGAGLLGGGALSPIGSKA